MNLKQKKMICYRIADEGVDYTLRCYSDFEEIKDEKFHELRKAFIKAAEEFEEYVGFKGEADLDEESLDEEDGLE